MTPEVLLDLARITRAVLALPDPLLRYQQLEQVLQGELTHADRQRYAVEMAALAWRPENDNHEASP